MRLYWNKIVGYCNGCTHLDYELTTFQIVEGYYKWFVDNKNGEAVASGYGLTNKIAKQAAEITLQQHLGNGENYEQINYGNYYFSGSSVR